MFYMHSFGWGWWLVMSIGMVAFWALVIYGLVWLLRGERPQQRQEASEESPQRLGSDDGSGDWGWMMGGAWRT